MSLIKKPVKKSVNFITFDIEEWYHANYDNVNVAEYQSKATNIEANVDRLIDICGEFNVKATCFILGSVAHNKPGIVKKLYNAGHEIASHSYAHKLIYKMTKKEFSDDLKMSKDILEDTIGDEITGFRAPSWSVNKDILCWFYDVLDDHGFKYSSSVYPAYTYLYGIPGFKREIHYPEIDGKKVNVLEIPVPVFGGYGKYIGYSGGFYLRFFPAWFINLLIKKENTIGRSAFLYLHPREIDLYQPKLDLNIVEKFIHYHGIKQCEKKLKKLMNTLSDTCFTVSEGIQIKNNMLEGVD